MIYLGDCRTILESPESPFTDATDMAQFIGDELMGYKAGIYWEYNPETDIHKFWIKD